MASRKDQKEQLRAQRLAKEQEEQAAARRKRLVQYGALAGLLAVVVVAALIIASQNNSSDSSGAGAGGDVADVSLVDNQLKGLPQNGLVLGDPKAKVSVIEFGDLQCPVCKEFSFQVAPDIISQIVRKGDANYEFRPSDIIGPQSPIASRAAYRRGRAGPRLELHRALLPKPGHRELRLRHRLVPDLDREGRRGQGPRQVEQRPVRQLEVGSAALEERQRRQEPRVHGHAVDPRGGSRREEAVHDDPDGRPDRGGRQVRLVGA